MIYVYLEDIAGGVDCLRDFDRMASLVVDACVALAIWLVCFFVSPCSYRVVLII